MFGALVCGIPRFGPDTTPFLLSSRSIGLVMAQQQFRFGTLRLVRDATLGTGAYGQVCKATLDELPCAAKLLHPILVDPNNPRNRTRFEQECRFLSEIRHPNIVQ